MNCFNGEQHVERALKSVIDQKYKNFELVFWDNLSSDRSKEIFEKFNDKRFKYFKAEKHKILYEARNDALRQCNGKYISFLDTDDFWFNNKLSSQVSIMEENDNVGLVYGNYIKYNQDKFIFKKNCINPKLFKSGKITKYLIRNYFIGLLTTLIRRSFMKDELEFFDTKYNLLSDFDYIIRFSKKHEIDFVRDDIAIYYQHKNQLQSKYIVNQSKQFESWYKFNLKNGELFEKDYDLKNIFDKVQFLNFVAKIKEKKKISFLKDLFLYPNNLYKIKLILIFFLPEKFYKRLFSFT